MSETINFLYKNNALLNHGVKYTEIMLKIILKYGKIE